MHAISWFTPKLAPTGGYVVSFTVYRDSGILVRRIERPSEPPYLSSVYSASNTLIGSFKATSMRLAEELAQNYVDAIRPPEPMLEPTICPNCRQVI